MKKIRPFFVVFFFCILTALPSHRARAYSDEVYALPEEVWAAARKTLEPVGIDKEDRKKNEITSQWVFDEVKRSKGLFKMIVKRVERRYRITYRFEERKNSVFVRCHGLFQDRSAASGKMIPWNKVKPDSTDYQVERDYFMKFLRSLAAIKQAKEAASAPAAA